MRKVAACAVAAAMLPVAAPAPARPLRVMTFNVRLPMASDGINRWDARRDLAAATIARAAPDVIGTQELFEAQARDLIARLPHYRWFGIDRRGGHGDEHMGVFYDRRKLRLVSSGNFWLSDTPDVPGSISWSHPYPRMVTWGVFERKGDRRRFTLANTHLPYRAQDDAAREKGARLIAGWIAKRAGPVVLTGDFNTVVDSSAYRILTRRLADARTAATRRAGPDATFHNFTGTPDRRIDWILTRGFRADAVRTLTDHAGPVWASDHFPVVADLTFQPRDRPARAIR